MSEENQLQDAHNRGQKDYAEENGYREPRNTTGFFPDCTDEKIAENDAYRTGYLSACEQWKRDHP